MLTTRMVGDKIAEARKKINLSQAQLAERLFISSQAVGKWERGESMPDIVTFNRLAEILGVDLNYFSESFRSVSGNTASAGSPVTYADELSPGKPKRGAGWDMSRGNWVGADFSGLKNLHEKFSSSNMQRCQFTGSDLSGLLLNKNNIENCDFSGSDISASHIESSNLVNNIFKQCSLREADFSSNNIKGCDFSGADFTGAVMKSCALVKNTVADAVWNRTSFNGNMFGDMVFTGKLENCSFENCGFAGVTFRNATLINTFFKNRSLKRIRFIDCQADRITYEFLKNGRADLTGITLLQ